MNWFGVMLFKHSHKLLFLLALFLGSIAGMMMNMPKWFGSVPNLLMPMTALLAILSYKKYDAKKWHIWTSLINGILLIEWLLVFSWRYFDWPFGTYGGL